MLIYMYNESFCLLSTHHQHLVPTPLTQLNSTPRTMQIQGNTFIVTGGLGGLGSDCVAALLHRGANVAVFDLLPQAEGDVKMAKLFSPPLSSSPSSSKLLYISVDICNQTLTKTAVQQVVAQFGNNLKGLVHCAGVALRRPWMGNDLSDSLDLFRKTLEVNAIGTFCINAAVGDAMNALTVQELGLGLATPRPSQDGSKSSLFWTTDQERGVIINFASVAGHEPIARVVGYGPSKSCVLGLTKSIADFYGPSGIRVNSVSPGIVETPMVEAHMDWFQRDLQANAIFPKRPPRPEHVTHAVIALIENEFINAEDIQVTGGWRLVSTTHPGAGDSRDAAPGLE